MSTRLALISAGVTTILTLPTHAEPTYGWTRTIGGLNADYCESVAVGPDGSVYLTGVFDHVVDFDPTDGVDLHQGVSDMFITRLNADGSYGWTYTYLGNAGSRAVATDSTCHVYVAGAYTGQLDFNPGAGQDVQGLAGGPRMFVTKLDCDGAYYWTRTMGSGVSPTDLAAQSDVVVVAGRFQSGNPVDFDPTEGVDNHTVSGVEDVFVTKLHADGTYAWTRTFGSPSQFANEGALGVAIGGNGDIIVVGRFRGAADFDPTAGFDTHASNGEEDAFVTKLHGDGTYEWTRTFGTMGYDAANKVAVDNSGNAYVVVSVNGETSPIVKKLDANGTELWSLPNCGGTSVAPDVAGRPVVLGGVTGDLCATKLDSIGTENGLWSAYINAESPASLTGYDLAVDARGNVVIAGIFYESVDFGFLGSGETDVHSAIGSRDIFVTKVLDTMEIPTLSAFGLRILVLGFIVGGAILIARRHSGRTW